MQESFMLLSWFDRSKLRLDQSKIGLDAFSAEFQLSPSFVLKCLGFSNFP